MWVWFVKLLVTFCIKLRYRVKVHGLDEVKAKGKKGILFLPNHPALIDPVIMNTVLFKDFKIHSLTDEKQVRTTALKYVAKDFGVIELPHVGIVGMAGIETVNKAFEKCVELLRQGENILMYPAGRLYRSYLEDLQGNGGVAKIIEEYPEVRIVEVRTRGLWGSSFSRSCGYQENFMVILKEHVKHLLLNLLFFSPRREVNIEFRDLPDEFPKCADKEVVNRALEEFYNEDAPGNTYVPYYWWEKQGARQMPEPEVNNVQCDMSGISDEVRQKVYDKLKELSPSKEIQDTSTLGTDLGLDSLNLAELQAWVQEEFAVEVNNPETLVTVGSVLLAAVGRSSNVEPLKPISRDWFVKENATPLLIPVGSQTVNEAFLRLAKDNPNFIACADQNSGTFSNRKIILAVMVLKSVVERFPEERIGVLMPSCAAALLAYLSVLFSGKTPVLVNWTVGSRNMEHCLKNAGVTRILTSRVVIERLGGRGTDFSSVEKFFTYLEDMKSEIGLWTKLSCVFKSYFCWSSLRNVKPSKYAAILFTSGSENLPKTVPLTHLNVLSDIDSAMKAMGLRADDAMLAMLPPFHSFGLLIDFLMPTVANLRVVFHANPLEGNMLARLIAAYRMTMMVGTPTFAANIMRNATIEQLASIRIMITGAEKCPDNTRDLFNHMCPKAYFLEGYGITECAPIVALNRPNQTKVGSVGLKLDILKAKVCDENGNELPRGTTGMLYVQGPNIFEGYINFDGPSPFVDDKDGHWYCTGDLVNIDENDFITFMGRLKRFVKIGGEMVSLPAIEEVLLNIYRTPELPLPLAVEAREEENQKPVIILFSVLDLDMATVNQQIREAGLSPIHYVKEMVKIDEIPLLGSGKTDYRSLKAMAKKKN